MRRSFVRRSLHSHISLDVIVSLEMLSLYNDYVVFEPIILKIKKVKTCAHSRYASKYTFSESEIIFIFGCKTNLNKREMKEKNDTNLCTDQFVIIVCHNRVRERRV